MTHDLASGILFGAVLGAALMSVTVYLAYAHARAAPKTSTWPEHTYFAALPMARCGCGADVPLYRVDAAGWRFARHRGLGRECPNGEQVAAGHTDQSRHCRCCAERVTGTCTPLPEPQVRFDINDWPYHRGEST